MHIGGIGTDLVGDILMSDVDCHRNIPDNHAVHPFPKLHVQRTVSASRLVVISLRLKCKVPEHVWP